MNAFQVTATCSLLKSWKNLVYISDLQLLEDSFLHFVQSSATKCTDHICNFDTCRLDSGHAESLSQQCQWISKASHSKKILVFCENVTDNSKGFMRGCLFFKNSKLSLFSYSLQITSDDKRKNISTKYWFDSSTGILKRKSSTFS